ncbi:hypothetical protein AKJ41_03915 [candidate division MSBL1 archaeon SCGC-AAA259O05]|uniref:YbaK/aminoacyl-tRNA synthetase-associated domain-containing protein n=1 Tax=candidate division MSBL1 archaeon SCGC-AAA259O05 TaxID=1698271 RepID=A0A133V2J3_9EURY|nr:hypothetical protein AKJ41_03915 [candidate division MSBL1 archaeon SCGC-AAA259O05]
MEAEFYEFSEPTLSVEDSARQLNVKPEKIVKSLVFEDKDDSPLLAIVSGVDRVDLEKLSDAHGSEVRVAKARKVEKFTGYKIGEVPPVSHGLETYVDEKIMDFDSVIAGGGSTHTLVELDPRNLIALLSDDCCVAKISEDNA